ELDEVFDGLGYFDIAKGLLLIEMSGINTESIPGGILHYLLDGDYAENIAGRFFVEVEIGIVVYLLISKSALDARHASVIGSGDEGPVAKLFIRFPQIATRRFRCLQRIVSFIYLVVDFQSVLSTGIAEDLPVTNGLLRRHIVEKVALDEGKILEVVGHVVFPEDLLNLWQPSVGALDKEKCVAVEVSIDL